MSPEEATGCILRAHTQNRDELRIWVRSQTGWLRVYSREVFGVRVLEEDEYSIATIESLFYVCSFNKHNPTLTWTTRQEAEEVLAEELL